ncbi:MAG: EsaB/YukD family protein [Chloroflexota bacterium]|nr:EsaB/YukD family protein [Chloroflexota bacterium]
MQRTLLVTVKGPRHTIDVELPGDIPISDLVPLLVEMCVPPSMSATNMRTMPWSLRSTQAGTPLTPTLTLFEAGVLDGVELVLQRRGTPPASGPRGEQFLPQSILPSEHTGGIGITWEKV